MSTFEQIEVSTLRSWLNNGDVTVLDIRDEGSFDEEHVPGAVCLQKENIESFIERTDKNKPLVCYCYHGISSQSAAQYFIDRGFKKAYSMVGGYEQWRCLV